jgi:hypothetical protein
VAASVYSRTFLAAARVVGGEASLSDYLRVPLADLREWIDGSATPPVGAFLKAVDLVIDEMLSPGDALARDDQRLLDELVRYAFSARAVAGAPDDPGLFFLWEASELVYIGTAPGAGVTIQSRLRDLVEGRDHCCCKPTHYAWRISSDVAGLERSLLDEYCERYLKLPRCNRAA